MTLLMPLISSSAMTLPVVLLAATFVVHLLCVHYVLGGAAYLAFGRLMGPKRCAVCGWQALLLEWLPAAAGLAVATGGALLLVEAGLDRQMTELPFRLPHHWQTSLPLLVICVCLLAVQRSAWLTRQVWFWRIPLAWAVFAGFAFIAASWTENHLRSCGDGGSMPARLGVWFFAAFATLAVQLAWQGRWVGMQLVQPPPGSQAVMGLSAVRRLALTATSGCVGVLLCGVAYAATLPAETQAATIASPWLPAVVAGIGLQVAAWGWTAARDRLPLAVLVAATLGCAIGLASTAMLREAVRAVSVETAAEPRSLTEFGEPDVAILGPHRPAGVELQSQHALGEGQRGLLVGEVEHQAAVEVVLDVVAFGADDHVVPVVDLHQFTESVLVDQLAGDLLAVGLPDGPLTHHADPAPLAPFVVDEARYVGKLLLVADLMLIATDDPVVAG